MTVSDHPGRFGWLWGVLIGGLTLILLITLVTLLNVYHSQSNHAQTIDDIATNTVQIKSLEKKSDHLTTEITAEIAGLAAGTAQTKQLLMEAGGAILQFDAQLKQICAVLPGCVSQPFTLGTTTTTVPFHAPSVVPAPMPTLLPVPATTTTQPRSTTTTTVPRATTTTVPPSSGRRHPPRKRQ